MAKDTYYFSHDYNVRTDNKIKRMLVKHNMVGYGIFWAIIEDLYNNANALQDDYESIAFDLRVDEKVVKSILNDFDLFEINDGIISSLSVQRRLDERDSKSTKARESALYRWNKDANALQTNTERTEKQSESNAIKERKEKERKEINIVFDIFWNLYDKKVGDKDKLKKKWESLNDDERQKAISHIPKYKESQPDKKFRKDPSTYLNNKSFNDEIISQSTPQSNFKTVEPIIKLPQREYWEIHYGHLAKTKEEFMQLVADGKIED